MSKLTTALSDSFQEMIREIILADRDLGKSMGLNITEFRCISLLMRYGSMPAGSLAKLTGLTTGTLTGVIDKLEKAGYARRVNDPDDRRVRLVELIKSKKIEKFFRQRLMSYSQRTKFVDAYSEEELKGIILFTKEATESLRSLRAELNKKHSALSQREINREIAAYRNKG